MTIGNEEAYLEHKGRVFKERSILSFQNGSPAVKEYWTEESGAVSGAKEIRVFDTLGQLIVREITQGTGGHIFGPSLTCGITKSKNDLPTEIVQTENTGNPLIQSIDAYVGKDEYSPIQLDTQKIELFWDFEKQQLKRTVTSEVVRYSSSGDVFHPKREERYVYDQAGRISRKYTTFFDDNDGVETSSIDDYEYKQGQNSGDILVFEKNYRKSESSMELVGVKILIFNEKSRKCEANGMYYNSKGYIDPTESNILELDGRPAEHHGEKGDLLPKTFKVDSFFIG